MAKIKRKRDTNEINKLKISPEQEEFDLKNTKMCRAIYMAMKEKGLNQNDLAEKMQVDKSLISRWLGGVHFMGMDTVLRIEKVLGINIINQDFLNPNLSTKKETKDTPVNINRLIPLKEKSPEINQSF